MNFLKFNFAKLLILVLFTTFLVSSCNKDENDLIIEQESIADNSKVELFKFDNVEHFQAYYEEQNALYDADYEQFNEIASAINVNTVHKKLKNQVFANPEDRYMPFLADPVMASIVNEDFQYQIGSELFTIINNEFMLRSDVNDQNLTMRFRSLGKGNSLNIESIPDNADIVSDESFEGLIGASTYSKKDLQESLESYKTGSCVKEEATNGWLWQQKTGGSAPYSSYGLSYKTRAYYSWGYTYEEAETFGYEKENGNWINKNLRLDVTIWAKRRSNSCVGGWVEWEDQYCSSCKSVSARVNKSGKKKHQTNDVIGTHILIINFHLDIIEEKDYVVF